MDNEYDDIVSKSKIMVFSPTLEEFRDFSGYVEYMEKCGAPLYGVAKVHKA